MERPGGDSVYIWQQYVDHYARICWFELKNTGIFAVEAKPLEYLLQEPINEVEPSYLRISTRERRGLVKSL